MKRQLLILLLLPLTHAFAQTNKTVVPTGFENQPGNGSDGILFTGGEMQQLFRASSLAPVWNNPVSISAVSFRVTEGVSLSYNATIPRLEVYLSTTARTPEQMSTSYFINRGADEKAVFVHDNVSLFSPAQPSSQVHAFDLRLTFDEPFNYDPSVGNLFMYIKSSGSGPGGRNIDSHIFGDGINIASSPVGATGNSGPIGNGAVVPYALINEFSWTAIPEPSSVLLAGSALIIVIGFSSKQKK